MTPAISVTGLTRRYPGQVALDDVHLTIGTGTITGLVGRNGAGKTTLLRILAGQEFPSSGSVRVFGSPPAENENVLRRLVLVREDQEYPDFKVSHALRAASFCYPNWDAGLASSLLEDFGLRANKAIKSLSRGQRSALGITIGLAARAEVMLFDEPARDGDGVGVEAPRARGRAEARWRGLVPVLLRERVFRRYWGASTISMFGDQISGIALPLAAVLALHVGAAQMGYLTGAFQAVNYGTRPVGALVGGLLGTAIGLRSALWVGVVGGVVGSLLVLRSPLPRFRMPPVDVGLEG